MKNIKDIKQKRKRHPCTFFNALYLSFISSILLYECIMGNERMQTHSLRE